MKKQIDTGKKADIVASSIQKKYGAVVKNVVYEGKFVQVSEAWLNSLIRDYNEMCALREAGVDNWQGYDEAIKIWKQRNPEDWKDE